MVTSPQFGPDLTLILSATGVIEEAIFGANLADEQLSDWIGQQWESTVTDAGPKKVRRLLDSARDRRVGGFSQINQRLPSGREILMEFSAVRSDTEQFGIVAVGKNLGVVVEQQQKLVEAQQAIEQNYWKLRDMEASYQAIIDSSSDAMLLVRKRDLVVVESNARARELLSLPAEKQSQAVLELGDDTIRVENILHEFSKSGHAPSTLIHLNPNHEPWRVKATQISGAQEHLFLLRFIRLHSQPAQAATSIAQNLGRANQSVVIVDAEGFVRMASESFAELTGTEGAAELVGQFVDNWLLGLDVRDLDSSTDVNAYGARIKSNRTGSRPVTVLVSPIAAADWSGFAFTIEVSDQVSNIH